MTSELVNKQAGELTAGAEKAGEGSIRDKDCLWVTDWSVHKLRVIAGGEKAGEENQRQESWGCEVSGKKVGGAKIRDEKEEVSFPALSD
ncbi:Hypothetical protein DEACI_3827 [Acididesulfobacillus acetoxydans]|uniref:Uncharacterized protein n=1 Tax=Acididesulfobacillus acetoxydans TaxID=1561005 RepID=A0A8S0WR20_9FIRM|nr:hypothetical protein [Acididesulfobacillus acetoxydans]CAA7603004.1 Hypothetical protein DEACI_3827 [Acididesulfobacillus acetoxydans]CEJ05886.1 Hypothetical protein DEACI_0306 [Acididesulfobacillus acetoxydans]